MVNLGDSTSRMMNTDGYAATGVEIKIVDEDRNTLPAGHEGEEASRGPNVFMGYPTSRNLPPAHWIMRAGITAATSAAWMKTVISKLPGAKGYYYTWR